MVPTRVSNHILDIIVTRSSSDIIISEIQPSLFLSDHCFLECDLSVARPNLRKKEIQFRRMRHINVDAFKTDIVSSNICNEPGSNLDDLMQRYDDTLSCIKHAPVQKKMIIERMKIPWFNDELKRMKVKRKIREKDAKSNCPCDKKLYRAFCNK